LIIEKGIATNAIPFFVGGNPLPPKGGSGSIASIGILQVLGLTNLLGEE